MTRGREIPHALGTTNAPKDAELAFSLSDGICLLSDKQMHLTESVWNSSDALSGETICRISAHHCLLPGFAISSA
jgi:hypothetical protein